MSVPLQGISSMATRQVLAELLLAWQARSGDIVHLESVGGVSAAQRVRAGEAFDLAFLASDAIDSLIADGHVLGGSRVDLMRSSTVVAVPAHGSVPSIHTEEALRRAVLQAAAIGYSTGPSGVALQKLFERWGIAEQIQARVVKPPPGVPVGSLLARGEVSLGFQQLSELMHVPDVRIVGPLPAAIAIDTVFSAGVVRGSANADAAQRLLAFLASPEAEPAKCRQGMEPV